jgi:hypothetical protein
LEKVITELLISLQQTISELESLNENEDGTNLFLINKHKQDYQDLTKEFKKINKKIKNTKKLDNLINSVESDINNYDTQLINKSRNMKILNERKHLVNSESISQDTIS